MVTNAQQIFKKLQNEEWEPLLFVVGEEAFQMEEILDRFKKFFVQEASSHSMNYESFDGGGLEVDSLLQALNQLPDLFAEQASRLVICRHVEKLSDSQLEKVVPYLHNPSPSTCFVMTASKADKRKAWYKAFDKHGQIVEVNEPYERDWPKWRTYFERKLSITISSDAWKSLVVYSGKRLFIIYAELLKLSIYKAEDPTIHLEDVQACSIDQSEESVFNFGEDVLCRNKYSAFMRLFSLLKFGESEIKILSILVRQFDVMRQCLVMKQAGVQEAKELASQIGAHPYFINKILSQSKHQTMESVTAALSLLSDCDFLLKTGHGSLSENFLVPYFTTRSSVA